jgi:phenylpropionate dioxygenase-like ring-hydroxylating dioxygenase large terminal subunit
MFASQHWYVVAMADEVTDAPLGRRVLDEPIVLYRLADGTPVALADQCPHRRYPLSLGRLVDDVLVCNYHGFSFDGTGRCVAVPGQDAIPSRADVRRYPLVERGPWIFAWMGDPSATDHAKLPDTPWLTAPDWKVLAGMQPLAARHSLLVDNLLDLSHETYLHAGFIGTPDVAATPIDASVDETGVVRVSRHMSGAECPPFYSRSTGLQSPIDRWQDIEFHAPGVYVLHSRVAPAGVAPSADGTDDPLACHAKILYGLTPSTATTTYDFWLVARDFAVDDPEVDEFMWKMNDEVVRQDVDALGVLEQRIAPDPDGVEVSIKIDRGALQARRVMQQLVDAERSSA